VSFFDISFWQGFVGNLFATIIGVALGIPIALWINVQVENNTEEEKKKKIIFVLWQDIYHIETNIQRWTGEYRDVDEILRLAASMSDESWRAFSDGGELQWIKNPWTLIEVAGTYAKINHARYLAYRLFEMAVVNSNRSDSAVRNLLATLNASVKDSLKTIEETKESLSKLMK
jgi:hypothetical protein